MGYNILSNTREKYFQGVRQLFSFKILFLSYWYCWISIYFFESSNDFQSYQSGIEISYLFFIGVIIYLLLSIVPKWNWNGPQPGEETMRLPFQSYQSGIEMRLNRYSTPSIVLSIVPKWNWNKRYYCRLVDGNSFNRTKVELKCR